MAITSQAALEIILQARDEASKVMNDVSESTGGLGSRVGNIARGALKVGTTAVAGLGTAAIGAGGAIAGLAASAAPVQGIGRAFEGVTEDADETLQTLREGSQGMIADADLMRSYNEAVQLVGKSFADDMPEAMQYLQKVSASTGQDLNYLMDSLTTGVGRMSPMILDNLGIQVDLTQATEDYAKSIGKSADELTEQEKKTALMNQVMTKLQDNTADMPDVTDNLSTSMAQMRATMTNLKNDVGMAFIPVMQAVLEPLADLAQKYGPQVTAWAEKAADWLGEKLPIAIDWLITKWQETWPQVQAALQTAWSILQPILARVAGWFSDDGPQAVGKLQKIWNTVWPQIQKVAQAVLGEVMPFIQEQFAYVVDWVDENWPLIQATVETVMGAIRSVIQAVLKVVRKIWEQHGEAIMANLQSVWTIIKTIISTAIRVVLGIIKAVMQIITGDWEGAWETIKGVVRTAWDGIKRIINEVGEIIKRNVASLVDALREKFTNIDWRGIGRSIIDGIKNGISSAAGRIADAAKDAARRALDAAKRFLGIGSPSKVFLDIGENVSESFAEGITAVMPDVAGAMQGLGTAIPDVQMGMAGARAGRQAGLAMAGGRGGDVNFNVTFGRDSVRSDDDIEEIMRRFEQILNVRGVRSWEV